MQRWGIGRRRGSLGLVVSVVVALVAGLVIGVSSRAAADAAGRSLPSDGGTISPPAGPATGYQSFVQATYRDFLGRPPQTQELINQGNRLANGQVSVASYLTGLATSDEWLTVIVTRFYRDTLQREPDAGGLAAWVGALRSGQLSVAQAASLFYASDEFYERFGGSSLSAWGTQLYQKLLGRDPDAAGLENWVRNANRFGRPWVTLFFYQSAESRSRRVQGLYQSLLQRDPDPTGWPHWTDALLSMSDLTLASQLASSQEYWGNAATRFPLFPGPPRIATTTLPDGEVGKPYSATITATEGVPPYTWTAWGLPAGLTMDPKTGVISGTPTQWVVRQQVSVSVTDAAGGPGSAEFFLTVWTDPVIYTTSLRYAVTGTPYTMTVGTGGGSSPPYTWSATGLPAGINLAPATGVLSGTPTTIGSFPVTLAVTDSRGKTSQKVLALTVRASEAAQQVSVGGYWSTCALVLTGGVRCWGLTLSGQSASGGTGSSSMPVDVVGLTSGVVAVSVGWYHACALTAVGGVKCWGDNSAGQLGNGTLAGSSTPSDVVGLTSGVSAISAGGTSTCALTTGGAVKCWGRNANGLLGDGTTTRSATPVNVVGLTSGVAAISVGSSHACALTTGGAVKCWGDNSNGRLGDGTTESRTIPVDVAGMSSGIAAISMGMGSSCAVTSTGAAKCWGANYSGQLGDGTTTHRSTPISVTGLTSGVASITAGNWTTCAVTVAGAVLCWGDNVHGSVGDGTFTTRLTPVSVVGLSSGSATAVGTSTGHSCALMSQGGVTCWGNNAYGSVGDGTGVGYRMTPAVVYGFNLA